MLCFEIIVIRAFWLPKLPVRKCSNKMKHAHDHTSFFCLF